MDVANLPWDKGVEVVFAVTVLKMLYDVVYKKVPRGFRELRGSLTRLEAAVMEVHQDHEEAMEALRACIARLEKPRPRPRRSRTRRGPGGPFP